MTMTPPTPVVIIALPVSNLRKAFAFYRDALALPLAAPRPDGSLPEPVEFRLNPGAHLMLVPSDGFARVLGGNPVAPPGSSECVVGLVLDAPGEVDATFAKALAAGGSAVDPPTAQPWGHSGTFRDLDGHIWMLSCRTPHAQSTQPSRPSAFL